MLRAFGHLLHNISQHAYDPTILQDVALKCFVRLTRPLLSVFRSGFRNTIERRCAESRPIFRHKNVHRLL